MADATTAAFKMMVMALEHQQIVAYMDVFSATVLIYDIIICLDMEIEHVWTRKRSLFSVLYITQRYLPLFDSAAIILVDEFIVDLSIRYCTVSYNFSAWSSVVGIMLSQIILTLRVWAVWKASITVAIGLIVFFLACWVSCCVLFGQFLSVMTFGTAPPNFYGCFITGGNDGIYLCWILWMVYDTGILVMMLIPGVAAFRRGGRSELIKTIYQDGVIYYVLMFLISVINVIVILTLPVSGCDIDVVLVLYQPIVILCIEAILFLQHDFVHLLTPFERVVHSLLTSRVILHIREVASQRSIYQTISQIRFTQNEHVGQSSSFHVEQSTGLPVRDVEVVANSWPSSTVAN